MLKEKNLVFIIKKRLRAFGIERVKNKWLSEERVVFVVGKSIPS